MILAALTPMENPYADTALLIAFLAFLAVLVDVYVLRRRSDLDQNLMLPLDDAVEARGHRTPTYADEPHAGNAKGAAHDVR